MSKKQLLAMTAAALAFGVATASAVDIDGKKGIGYAQAIGGPAGLAFNFGTGNLNIEGILGVDMYMPDAGDGSQTIALGVGAHFHALRAENASMTVGGRVNIGIGKNPTVNPDGAPDQESITQFGIDIPVRVYWFPDKHVSLHAEMGISVIMTPEKGAVWPGPSGAKGMDVVIGGSQAGTGAFGNMGLTFWW